LAWFAIDLTVYLFSYVMLTSVVVGYLLIINDYIIMCKYYFILFENK
jgi:hypothetical protein